MKETSRETDAHTLKLLDSLKGTLSYSPTIHLLRLRNSLNGDIAIPKSRNTLGRLVYGAFTDRDWRNIIPALSFIELSTTATYVIDDILDNQPTRQSDESTWKRYGVNRAISAGGIQQARGFKALEDLAVSDKNKIRIFSLGNKMWDQLWQGEMANEDTDERMSDEQYFQRCYLLGGVMWDTVGQISAISAGASEDQINLASKIGRYYGITAMIRNDLADVVPSISEQSLALSKRPYEDVQKGVWTYPLLSAMRNADSNQRQIIQDIMGNKDCTPEDYQELQNTLRATGALTATLDLITRFRRKTKQHIAQLPDKESRNRLYDLVGLLENMRKYVK